MLKNIEKGEEYSTDIKDFDDDELEDYEIGNKIKVKLKDLDIIKLRNELLEDKNALQYLIEITSNVTVKDDAKLTRLKQQITNKVNNPINPNNNKIIIFSVLLIQHVIYMIIFISGFLVNLVYIQLLLLVQLI